MGVCESLCDITAIKIQIEFGFDNHRPFILKEFYM